MSDGEESRAVSPVNESVGREASEDREALAPEAALDKDDDDHLSGDDSDLSEVDEAQFEDFDAANVALEDRPLVGIDEDVARTLKAGKRKKAAGEGKKAKEGRREKKKKTRRDSDEDPDGMQLDGKRTRKPKRIEGDRERTKEKRKATPEPENEELLTPEERRRRALDRAMDAALKNPNKRRRKKDEVDLEEAFDDEIAALKIRMEKACEADNADREANKPALNKLRMLPEVVALLNRNTVQHSIVDPDTNFLLSVKFFLEPLNDGSLPAYNIQRDVFTALTRLPIEKEALLSSGIGKVVLYYTKSKKPEIGIKRIAERLLGEWSRPILKRSDDYKKRKIETREYDHKMAEKGAAFRSQNSQSSQMQSSQRGSGLTVREMERERMLAPNVINNRARMESSTSSYTVAPASTFTGQGAMDKGNRPIGESGLEAFRRITNKKKRGFGRD